MNRLLRTLFLLLCNVYCVHSGSPFFRRIRIRSINLLTPRDDLSVRGGTMDDKNDENGAEDKMQNDVQSDDNDSYSVSPLSLFGDTQSRHCSDLILDLRRRAMLVNTDDESLVLRKLIASRSIDYLNDLRTASSGEKLTHPRKLLHFLAPKVPAIKHSPDVSLRIHSARSDIDSGIAACIIGTLAHVCEVYDNENGQNHLLSHEEKPASAVLDIISDRRFEQLVECLLSGINMKKRKMEALTHEIKEGKENDEDIEELLNAEDLEESDGLSVRDACRAAWGVALLAGRNMEKLGDENILEVLQALSLRIRELLLARLKLLRQGDLMSEPGLEHMTVEDRMDQLSKELAEDAAAAMWSFACVRACTGIQSVPMFETCCSVLCQDPVDLRKRAQETEVESEVINVGNNDVVDRLANAESDNEDESIGSGMGDRYVESETASKDSLLDWLSRQQMNDVIWALALHGKESSTTALDDTKLSETAATLGEIIFDRLIETLENDLENATNENTQLNAHNYSCQSTDLNKAENVEVEVVDAATLLSTQAHGFQSSSTTTSENIVPVESLTVQSTVLSTDQQVEEVQVVDAAALLAAEADSTQPLKTEVMLAPVRNEMNEGSSEDQLPIKNPAFLSSEMELNQEKPLRTFTSHDLASIAWSVVELHDPLRMQVLPIVIRLVAMHGEYATDDLSGADLANLAWAVAKYESEASVTAAHKPNSLSLSVTSWIVNASLQKISDDSESFYKSNLLDFFQPPELGRLLWAVACILSTYAQVPDHTRQNENLLQLATQALLAASDNLDLFATEDLLRIGWSFLEIRGTNDMYFQPVVYFALGRILSTVEQSLYRWERGDCAGFSKSDGTKASVGHHEGIFSSFFGKPRRNQPLLDQLVSDHDDDDDMYLAPIVKKSRRPLLKDLSVDPSTLCKASCAFQRLQQTNPEIKGGWKVTSVAIRLLTSKNARLMRECSIHDIVRLCEAAVRSETEGQGRQLITGLFAHKVVQVLNEVLDEAEPENNKSTTTKIGAASPAEIATLTWALGYLGVRHMTPDNSRAAAYKRLRLMSDAPLLKDEQITMLDLRSLNKLIRGMVLMKSFNYHAAGLLHALHVLYERADSVWTIEMICSVAETIALLKEAISSGMPLDENRILQQSNNTDSNQTGDDEEQNKIDTRDTTEDALMIVCDNLLSALAEKIIDSVTKCSALELRRLLTVYSLLPFSADTLVDTIDQEVKNRLSDSSFEDKEDIGALLLTALGKSKKVKAELFQEADSSTMSALKNGFMSLFRSIEEENTSETSVPEDLSILIQEAIDSTINACNAVQSFQDTSKISIQSIGHHHRDGTFFELGRCQELISNYRLVEFSTGKRRSRYNNARRTEMSKRVLSRLLP